MQYSNQSLERVYKAESKRHAVWACEACVLRVRNLSFGTLHRLRFMPPAKMTVLHSRSVLLHTLPALGLTNKVRYS